VIQTLPSAPYSFDWDTSGVQEGPHTVVAEVALSSGKAQSNAVTIVVDRQPPIVASTSPSSGATNVMLRSPIQIFFSEQVVFSQPAGSTFSLSAGTTRSTT
jgi:hypothetical protein